MSRRARRRAGRVALNTMDMAMSAARALSEADVAQQMALVRAAVRDLAVGGPYCGHYWVSLADTANMAETLADMGFGGNVEARQEITDAQAALADVHRRQRAGRGWALYGDEIQALQGLAAVHEAQLRAVSYGEFSTAYRRAADRMAQALAGNAAPGVVVVVGQLAQEAQPAP